MQLMYEPVIKTRRTAFQIGSRHTILGGSGVRLRSVARIHYPRVALQVTEAKRRTWLFTDPWGALNAGIAVCGSSWLHLQARQSSRSWERIPLATLQHQALTSYLCCRSQCWK